MRKGQTLDPLKTSETDEKQLARIIVGRDQIWEVPEKFSSTDRAPILKVENLCVRNHQTQLAVKNLSLQVRPGEILGIAGVEGNGQAELMSALAGLTPVAEGRINFDGKDVTGASVSRRRALGIKHIPEDRLETGLCLEASIAENLIADPQDRNLFVGRYGIVNWQAVKRHAEGVIDEFNIVAPGPEARTKELSGGNLQKVVAARELARNRRCLLVLHPTRGLDIGAAEFIYQRMLQAREEDSAILMVSADLDEIFLISDRIVVIYEGEIVAEFRPDQVTPQTVGLYMTGARRQNRE
jgi:general nucleoside transport system ATP-binding protein